MDYGFALVSREGGTSAPLVLADVKSHLRVDGSTEDTYIEDLLNAAIEKVETDMNIVLQQATCRLTLRQWPSCGEFVLPRFPLSSVTSVTYLEDGESTPTTWASTNYRAETDALPPRIVAKKDILFPTATLESGYPVTVTAVMGYADDAWPDRALHAIRLLVGHWYLHREAVATGTIATNIPEAYRALVLSGRLW